LDFEQWWGKLKNKPLKLSTFYDRFHDQDGDKFHMQTMGVFNQGQDSIDLNEVEYDGPVGDSTARFAAWLYFMYKRIARREGWEVGEWFDFLHPEDDDDPDFIEADDN